MFKSKNIQASRWQVWIMENHKMFVVWWRILIRINVIILFEILMWWLMRDEAMESSVSVMVECFLDVSIVCVISCEIYDYCVGNNVSFLLISLEILCWMYVNVLVVKNEILSLSFKLFGRSQMDSNFKDDSRRDW